jgi:hypothetical protein
VKSIQPSICQRWRGAVVAGLVLVGAAQQAAGQTLILSDSFSGTDGATINGRTPDGVNLPGQTFVSASYVTYVGAAQSITTSDGAPGPAATTGFNGSITYNLSSNGGYTKPTQLTLSLDIEANTSVDAAPASLRGVGLGFYSAPPCQRRRD